MPHKFYHIGVLFPFQPRSELIDMALTAAADDWVRYTPNTWIVWSEKSSEQLYRSINYLLNQTEQVLVAEIVPQNQFGMLSKLIWDWFELKRESPEKTLAEIIALLPPKTPE